jgi:hypothetical protein
VGLASHRLHRGDHSLLGELHDPRGTGRAGALQEQQRVAGDPLWQGGQALPDRRGVERLDIGGQGGRRSAVGAGQPDQGGERDHRDGKPTRPAELGGAGDQDLGARGAQAELQLLVG